MTKQNTRLIDLPSMYSSAGCTTILLPDSSIPSLGGSSMRVSVSTYKPMNPELCYHWEKEYVSICNIANSPEGTPFWIECEMPGCKTWLHLFCIKEEVLQVDPWYCKPRKDGKKAPKTWRH